jgi:hypothetical protein
VPETKIQLAERPGDVENLLLETTAVAASSGVSTSVSQARRLATFAVLSSLSVLAWQAQTAVPFGRDLQTAGFLLALIVLLRPFSRFAFLSLAAVETLAVLSALPTTNTNRLLQLFIYFSIASTAVYGWLRGGFRRLEPGAWLALFQPLLRLQIVIVYALAAWHKLNVDFLNPQSSCAVLLYEGTPFWHLHAPATGLRWFLIISTIATEAALPVLLCMRCTRNLAVGYGTAFHICLGFSGFYAFSVTMISLLFLFTPGNFCDLAVGWWRDKNEPVRRAATIAFVLLAAIVLALTVIQFGPPATQLRSHGLLPGLNVFWIAWSEWAGYWMLPFFFLPLALFLLLWLRQPSSFQPLPRPFAAIAPTFWIVPALLLFDGLNPYLGLKTDTAFAMYSNLRTEEGRSNHLIWRHPLALAGYQTDLVRVVDSNEPALQSMIHKGLPITFIDLRRGLANPIHQGRQNISVTYIRNGETIHVQSAESDPVLGTAPSFLETKLLLFRPITTQGCSH